MKEKRKPVDPFTGDRVHPVLDWITDNTVPLALGIVIGSVWTMLIGLAHLLWLVAL